jgi:hypothetical protein
MAADSRRRLKIRPAALVLSTRQRNSASELAGERVEPSLQSLTLLILQALSS